MGKKPQNKSMTTIQSSRLRTYDLNGVGLLVSAPDETMAGCLDPWLAPFADRKGTAADWTVRITVRPELPEPAGELLWEGMLPEGLTGRIHREGDNKHLQIPGHVSLTSERTQKALQLTVCPGKEWVLPGSTSVSLLGEVLAGSERHLIHAAALLPPALEENVLFFAPSGTGKTTTALALAREGWQLLGDDAVVLGLDGDDVFAWSIPRSLKIHQRTAAMLPWIKPFITPWRDQIEQVLPINALVEQIAVGFPSQRCCRAIVILEPPNPDQHVIAPIDRAEALQKIVGDNVRMGPDGVLTDGMRAFHCLASLVQHVQTLRMSVGPELTTLGPALVRFCL
jgi:hypothetical protein